MLSRNGNKIFYKYSCCVAKIKNCFTGKTLETDFVDMSTLNLYKQQVTAKENNVLNNFRLVSAAGKVSYDTNVCVLG